MPRSWLCFAVVGGQGLAAEVIIGFPSEAYLVWGSCLALVALSIV
jgi:hypothetical protein